MVNEGHAKLGNDFKITCPHCRASVTAESVCESVWNGCLEGTRGAYACCGKFIELESVHEATAWLTNNAHVGSQVMDLKPPHDNLQINVARAYRTVITERIPSGRVKTDLARRLFDSALHDEAGSGTKLPILIGYFDGGHLLIDGIHRINDAFKTGMEYVPVFSLNAEQTNAVTERRSS